MLTFSPPNLQAIITASGKKITQISISSGLSEDSIYKLLSGARPRPSAETLSALSYTLGCKIEDLMSPKRTTVAKNKMEATHA